MVEGAAVPKDTMDTRDAKASSVVGAVSVNQEEFRPALEVFQNPSDLDFLLQHGGSSQEIALARQSLYVKFDPLVTGRPSMFPSRASHSGAAKKNLQFYFNLSIN